MINTYINNQLVTMKKTELYDLYLKACKKVNAEECNIMTFEQFYK